MQNPTYLSLSRHNIYYFRWPLPSAITVGGKASHIKLSLRTREPKEALYYSKVLAYHGYMMEKNSSLYTMSHAEIVSMLKSYFSEILERAKKRIDQNGPLASENVQNIEKELELIRDAISDDRDELHGDLFDDEELPDELSINKPLNKILERFDIELDVDSQEYIALREEYKYAIRNYYESLLFYNRQVREYSFVEHNSATGKFGGKGFMKPEHRLSVICDKFIKDQKRSGSWGGRALEERVACLDYLMELLGKNFDLLKLDNDKMRYVKDMLLATPTNRSKNKLTRDLPLLDQVKVEKVPKLSNGSVNKYLQCYSSMMKWAVANKYIENNPFEGVRLKDKKKGKREQFTKAEIGIMLNELAKKEEGLANKDYRYWGALLAIYTGARLNEIASLTPDDIKQDQNGIWYIEINDEDEAKQLKTDAAKRIVPIHSSLIDLGFLSYVNKARANLSQDCTRLLYELTYKEKEGWGRKLGRWFNEEFLVTLGLKVPIRKTLHSLRHSFITSLSVAGVDGASIKSMVGHEADTVTSAVYTHYGIDHLPAFKEAIEKLRY